VAVSGRGRARKPRLCMVVHAAYPQDVRVFREARLAVREGYDVHVVALREEGQAAKEVVEDVQVVRVPVSHRRGASWASMIAEYVSFCVLATTVLARRTISQPYDIVQIHNPPDFLVASALLPKIRGARMILDVHDLSSDMFSMRFEGRFAKLVERPLRLVERLAARFADAVITVHEPYRNELVARGVPAAKIVVVMNTVDETLLPQTQRTKEEGFRIVYHGTITPHYGVELLLEAAASLRKAVPGLHLDIFGAGDALPDAVGLAHRLGIDDLVEFSNQHLPQREVLARVQSAAVGVVPNLPIQLNRYALSSKLFEYVALGVPVACADLSTLRQYFAEDEVAFFKAGDVDSLAAVLRRIADDPVAAAKSAAAARRRYDEEYRWEIQSRAYSSVLARLSAGE
jgi:glycosyltransferase involved in cell wall biosynthesis